MRSPGRHVITGSIATDHLMTFPGSFTEQFVDGQLHKVSLSFLVDELTIRRGGIAANVAFGMARLGLHPVLVGSVGADFESYRQWLETHHVDTRHIRVSETLHTARFLCTTDDDNNQIASFYAGAMAEARHIDLRTVLQSVTDVELVFIGPDDPDAMLRHTRTCRDSSIPFAADPSQQIARMDGTDLSLLIRGARYLFTNEYERGLLIRKTGIAADEILESVGAWVTTLGPAGVTVTAAGRPPIRVPAAAVRWKADPTGVGDAFRAGFLAGTSGGLGNERSAQMGCVMAALVLETTGTQEYDFHPAEFIARISDSYGPAAAADVAKVMNLTPLVTVPDALARLDPGAARV